VTEDSRAKPLHELVSLLPARIWYLTSNGQDMWCRRPYGFFFSSSDAAEAFVRDVGTEYGLTAIGMDAGDLMTESVMEMLQQAAVTRIFVDPSIDPASGDVFGKILRIQELN
jgi:hypothetical protein